MQRLIIKILRLTDLILKTQDGRKIIFYRQLYKDIKMEVTNNSAYVEL